MGKRQGKRGYENRRESEKERENVSVCEGERLRERDWKKEGGKETENVFVWLRER